MGRAARARKLHVKSHAASEEKPTQAPAGMREAARRAQITAVRIEEGVFRVGAATVRVHQGSTSCDCPMANAPACLHRLIAAGSSEETTGEGQTHDDVATNKNNKNPGAAGAT